MTKNPFIRSLKTRPTVIALALVAAFGSAYAADGQEVEGSVSVGAGVISGSRDDRGLFDQYSGYPPGSDAVGILGADYYRRDPQRGIATQFHAGNLLNGDRELGFSWRRYGDWKFTADLRELTRVDPKVANTGLVGGGTTTPQVVPLLGGPGTGGDMDLKIKRTNLGLGFSKVLSSRWQFDVSLATEKKEGSRLFGIGMTCPTFAAPGCLGTTSVSTGWATLMVPEPVDSNTTQTDARVSFAGERLSLSLGYYGSFYRNDYGSLNPSVPGSLYNPVQQLLPLSTGLQAILNNPVALWPDNQSQQVDVTGGYRFTPTTHGNFKLAYSQATQTQNFAGAGLTGAPAGVSDLGGKLSTTLAQIGVSSRPVPKLSLNANVHYEHRSDSTPLALYGLGATIPFTNRQYPLTTTKAKVEAAYQFTSAYRGLIGATVHDIDRGTVTPTTSISGVTALRSRTDETGVHAELRKRMSETFTGAIGLESSKRTGSDWLRPNSGTGVTDVPDPMSPTAQTIFSLGIFPVYLADRRRDALKISADWQPTDKLGLQLVARTGRDSYDVPSAYGVHKSDMDQISVDWTYALNDNWNLNGFLSYDRQQLDQARPAAAFMAFDDTSIDVGVGATGHVSSKIDVGGTLGWLNDRSKYAQTLDVNADAGSAALLAATGGLPDTRFRQASLKLFGKYTIDKASNVRLDLIHLRSYWNDWQWGFNGVPYVYSDATTINGKTSQAVSFLGVTYTRRWP